MDVKVAERFLNRISSDLTLKTYIFDAVKHRKHALNMLENYERRGLFDHKVGKEYKKVGEFGVAFLYEYPTKESYIVGADVSIFRGTLEDLDKDNNPMVHTWTIENGEELHRNKDGTMCTVEAIILGEECTLMRKNPGEDIPTFRNRIFNTWPNIDDFLGKEYNQPAIPDKI